MKKYYLLWLLSFFSFNLLHAAFEFSPNLRYRLVCKSEKKGSLVLGSKHESTSLLYYLSYGTTPQDAWWYIEKSQKGYTLRNAVTSEYITYDQEFVPQVKSGLTLSNSCQAGLSEWSIDLFNKSLIIRNVNYPGQWFTLGADGPQMIGTSIGAGSLNQRFSIYDELGRNVNPEDTDAEPPHVDTDFAQAFDSICINQKQLVYDAGNKVYYYPLPDSVYQGKPFCFNFSYCLKDSNCTHTVLLDPVIKQGPNGLFTISQPDCDTRYLMTLKDENGQNITQSYLRFTYLPIVEISLDYCEANRYNKGAIRVTDGNHKGTDSLYNASFRYRGNTSLRYDKKSFNIKLKDADGNSLDRSFFGLRSDNRWILDAMTIDGSCMRNRIGMELWNDYAALPYYAGLENNVRTGTRGNFVEVFWNGEYHGLFCMSERIDRKQLKLKKFIPTSLSPNGHDETHGLLYKGKEWGYEVLMGVESKENQDMPGRAPAPYTNLLGVERWANYDFKYPDYKTEAVDWKPLYDCVNFVATSSQQDFEQHIAEYLDMPVVIDYYLLLDIMLASDNCGKNMYYFTYDKASPDGQKLSLAPWDLDAAFGIDWEGYTDRISPAENIHDFGGSSNGYYLKLRKSQSFDWQHILARRYAELRHTYFSKESLLDRFHTYGNLFAASSADRREETRWGGRHADIQGGIKYACEWIDAHIDALDEYYGYDPTISAINQAASDQYISVKGQRGGMVITCHKKQHVSIYHISGQLVRSLEVHEGDTTVEQLTSGIYLVNGHKVSVK